MMADVVETDYSTDPPTVVERDFTAEEKAQRKADEKAAKDAEKARHDAEKVRAAAVEKLRALGLTDADLAALGIAMAAPVEPVP